MKHISRNKIGTAAAIFRMSLESSEIDKKPDIRASNQSTHINIKVRNQDGNEVIFRVRKNLELEKMMSQYCDHQAIEINTVRFLLDGKRIKGRQTPDQLEMEDGDQIDAMQDQVGA